MRPRYLTTVDFDRRIILAREEMDGILSGTCNAASRLILETAILGAPMLFPPRPNFSWDKLVTQRSGAKRPKLTSGARLLWICLSRLWRVWRSVLAIVKPETVLAWRRAAFRERLLVQIAFGIQIKCSRRETTKSRYFWRG